MALVLADRVQETTTTAGTGALTLDGAVGGFQSFAVVGNGNICYYTIVDGASWEVGIGTYSTTGPTLSRTTVLSNSSGTTSPLTLSSASKPVFLTYPAEKSVNLDSSGNVSPLGTVSSGTWQGSTVGVAYGGTGVTSSSGANSVMLRDANQNVTINRLNQSSTTITAAGGTTTLTAASTFSQILVGTGGQTFKLPDATTLTNTTTFEFNNNATGTLTITDYANATVGTISSGGAAALALLANGTVGGTWDVHAYIPENVTWGTNSLALGATVITGGTWNGGTITPAYGGTGLTSYTSGGAIYATGTSTLTSGTLPVASGGTGATTVAGAQSNLNVLPLTGGTLTGKLIAGSADGNSIEVRNDTANSATSGYITFINKNSVGVYRPAARISGVNVDNALDGDFLVETYSGNVAYKGLRVDENSNVFFYDTSGNTKFQWDSVNIRALINGYVVLTAANYNSYAPTLTGGGASGTWNINITGSAGSVPATSVTNLYSPNGASVVAADSAMPTTGQSLIATLALGPGGNDGHIIGMSWANTTAIYGAQLWLDTDPTNRMSLRSRSSSGVWNSWADVITSWSDDQVKTGYFQSNSSLRAPIFYDSNNTAYYLDPTSTSVLSAINLPAGSQSINTTTPGTSTYQLNFTGQGTADYAQAITWGWSSSGAQAGIYVQSSGSYGTKMYLATTDSFATGAKTAVTIDHLGVITTTRNYLQATGSLRAPIFYDSDDTTYYLDPNNTGIALSSNGIVSSGYGTNGGFQNRIYTSGRNRIWSFGNADAYGISYFQGGPDYIGLHFGTTTAAASQFWVSDSGISQTSASSRAPIFYASDDTNYYLDPNAYSFLYYTSVNVGQEAPGAANSSSAGLVMRGNYNSNTWAHKFHKYDNGSGVPLYLSTTYGGGVWTATQGWGGGLPYTSQVYGSFNATASVYSPIFYDSDNTGYYCDPANISNFNTRLNITAFGTYSPNYAYGLQMGANAGIATWNFNPGGSSEYRNLTLYATGWNGSAVVTRNILTIGNYGGYVGIRNDFPNYELDITGTGYAANDFRAPIFYDSNNTGYYCDPASTSRLSNVNYDNLYYAGDTTYGFIGRNIYADTVNGRGTDPLELNYYDGGSVIIGTGSTGSKALYAGSLYSTIFYDSDNTGYYVNPNSTSRMSNISLDTYAVTSGITGLTSAPLYTQYANAGTTNTWYPMTYQRAQHSGGYVTHLNTGLYKSASGWGGGATGWYAAIGGNDSYPTQAWYLTYDGYIQNSLGYIYTSGSFRAPIFYDADNTGYYCDPSGLTFLYNLQLSGAAYFRPNNWIELDGDYGIYSAVYNGAHFLANVASSYGQWRLIGSRNSYGGIYDTYSAVNGIMYDGNGNGGVYREANGRWYWYYNLSNDCMGIGTSGTSSTYSLYLNKGVYAQARIDAPIFYDLDNTLYYGDFAGTSRINTILFDQLNSNGYNTPNQLVTSGDANWAYGCYNSSTTYYMQVKFYGTNDDARGFRVLDASNSTVVFRVNGTGSAIASGNVTAYSDERLKHNWRSMPENFVPRLAQIRVGIYDRIDGSKLTQVGVGAQSLQSLLPEAVNEAADEMHTLSVNYGGAALASAVELAKYVTALEQRISQLEARL